jgi:hypothetical protein
MADTMVETVLPKELRLGVPPKMPQARSYMYRQQSTLPSYTYGSTITINVPRLQRSYLSKESYLRFRMNGYYTPADPNHSLVLDTCGAWGLFEKLEVFDYLGSTVLESTSGHPQLASLLLDMGLKEIIDKNIGSAVAGLDADYVTNGDIPFSGGAGSAGIQVGTTNTITQGGVVRPPNAGATLVPGFSGSRGVSVNSTNATVSTGGVVTLATSVATSVSGTYTVGQAVLVTSVGNASTGLTAGTVYYVVGTPTATGFTLSATSGGGAINLGTEATGVQFTVLNVPFSTAPGQIPFSREFSIPLLSFLGLLSKKMVPLHNGYTIVLTVANQKKPIFLSQPIEPTAIVTGSGTSAAANGRTITTTITTDPTTINWNITDVYLQCRILELGPVAESMILSSTQGNPLVVHTKQFRNYVHTVKGAVWGATAGTLTSTGQQEFVLNLNLNVASLTNILWIQRPQTYQDSYLYPSCGARTRNFLQRWQFQYGSTTLPQNNGIQAMSQTTPLYPNSLSFNSVGAIYAAYAAGFTECFQEFLNARPLNLPSCRFNADGYAVDSVFNQNLDQRLNPVGSLNWKNYFPSKDSWQSLPRFAAGLNLQLVNNKDGDMISGLNTNGMNTSIRGLFNPLFTDLMANTTIDAFAEYDAFINISPGIATTVSF